MTKRIRDLGSLLKDTGLERAVPVMPPADVREGSERESNAMPADLAFWAVFMCLVVVLVGMLMRMPIKW